MLWLATVMGGVPRNSCLGFPPAAGLSPVGRRSLRLFGFDAGLDWRVGGDINHWTNCQWGGAKMDRGPSRRPVHLVLTSVRCQDSAANKNTPQLERKIRLHSPPKHFVAFAPVTGVQLGESASRASARSHVPTLKASPQQRQGST